MERRGVEYRLRPFQPRFTMTPLDTVVAGTYNVALVVAVVTASNFPHRHGDC
jgi:hypothetical protein